MPPSQHFPRTPDSVPTHRSGRPSFPWPWGKKKKKKKEQARGLIDHSLSLGAGTRLQAGSPGWCEPPGAPGARELSVASTRLAFLRRGTHRLLGNTFRSGASSRLLCRLAARRQPCATARSFLLVWCQGRGAWTSFLFCPVFPFRPRPHPLQSALFCSLLPPLSLIISATPFCISPCLSSPGLS